MAVIEFQKQGSPHCHILTWIKQFGPTAKNIDDMTCAEIPPPSDPIRNSVVKTMIHSPCGPQYTMTCYIVRILQMEPTPIGFFQKN